MGIQQITKMATNAMAKLQKMPLPKQAKTLALVTTGVFGLGVIAGKAMLGDNFEKEQVTNLQQENDSLRTANDSINKELAILNGEKEKEMQEKTKTNGLKKVAYTPPVLDGDVKADTTAIYRNGKPAEISYSKNGKVFEIQCLNPDGSYDGYATVSHHTNKTVKSYENAYGKYSHTVENYNNGTYVLTSDGITTWETEYYNEHPENISFEVTRETLKNGQNIYETFDGYIDQNKKRKEVVSRWDDKTGAWVKSKEKEYDDSGLLKFTVTPKYNSDGDLIKRDTVWVNK